MITATCHSDDFIFDFEMDVTPWFKQADFNEIYKLMACGWGGDYPADEVAIFMAGINEECADMFKYLERIANIKGKKDESGFECYVDKEEALRWLEKNEKNTYEGLTTE
jgi:hypothetical protein